MDIALIQRLSSDLRIGAEQIVREFWEMALLKELSDEDWSGGLGFKGGTALRLAYGSPRYSDDLDFALLTQLKATRLFSWARAVSEKYAITISDNVEKRNTLLVEFRIRSEALTQPIKQKIEISKRQGRASQSDYQLKLVSSPTTNSQVILPVAPLELMWEEKISAMRSRKEPRDLFDLWYIGEKLNRTIPPDLPKIPVKLLRTALGRYLPSNYKKVISTLETI